MTIQNKMFNLFKKEFDFSPDLDITHTISFRGKNIKFPKGVSVVSKKGNNSYNINYPFRIEKLIDDLEYLNFGNHCDIFISRESAKYFCLSIFAYDLTELNGYFSDLGTFFDEIKNINGKDYYVTNENIQKLLEKLEMAEIHYILFGFNDREISTDFKYLIYFNGYFECDDYSD